MPGCLQIDGIIPGRAYARESLYPRGLIPGRAYNRGGYNVEF